MLHGAGWRNTAVVLGFCGAVFSFTSALGADVIAQAEIAAAPPALLNTDVRSRCIDGGSVFKIVNRGAKWPQTGVLKLYHSDDNTLIGQRRLRLAGHQKLTFVVKDAVMKGRPVGVWIDPAWYARGFTFDAAAHCP